MKNVMEALTRSLADFTEIGNGSEKSLSCFSTAHTNFVKSISGLWAALGNRRGERPALEQVQASIRGMRNGCQDQIDHLKKMQELCDRMEKDLETALERDLVQNGR